MSYSDLAGTTPYFDDFNANLNFLKILSVPGRAVQARELTQAQTILQNQIGALGGHVFENNSLVIGGEIDFNVRKPAAKIQPVYYDSLGIATGTTIDPESLIGNRYSNAAENSKITITQAQLLNGELFIYYTFTGLNAETDELLSFSAGTNLNIKLDGSPFNATAVQCKPGIIFKDSFFVTIVEQERVIANTNSGIVVAGYRFEEDIVTEDEPFYGSTLRDPANGSYNRNAPGAHRYRITPVLDGYEDDPLDTNRSKIWSIQDNTQESNGRRIQVDDFFQKFRTIVVTEDGNVIKDNQRPIYGDIINMIARRTFDESGNYTIDNFTVTCRDNPSSTELSQVIVSPGKAYVKGFEIEKLAKTILSPTKARQFNSISNGRAVSKGMYYVILDQEETSQEQMRTTGTTEYPSFEKFTEVTFYGSNDSIIGTARLLNITRQSSDYRAYFANIQEVVPNISTVSYFKVASGDMRFFLRQGESGPDIFGGRSPLIYPINGTIYTKSVGLITYDTNLEIEVVANGSGEATIVRTPGEVEFYDDNNGGIIMAQNVNGTQLDIDTLTSSGGSTTTITGLNPNDTHRLILKAEIVDAQQRTKSLTTVSDELVNIESDGNTVVLSQEDVYEITSIKEVGAGGDYIFTDLEVSRIKLDSGSRDFWYTNGEVSGLSNVGVGKRNSGGTRQFKISYRYFTHSALTENSQHFTVNSYATDFSTNLGGIGTYTASNKVAYNLHDCIDFRPKLSDLVGSESNIINPYGRMTFSYETYMPRIDRVWISSESEIGITEGIPSGQNNPDAPPELDETMTLATLFVPAYTPISNAIKVKENDNRRYRMQDIGKLEDRIENLEVYTSLTALERSAADLNISDANGFNRFKNGILVDPFNDHLIGNVFDDEYRAVTYPGGGMTCPFEAVSLEFEKDITPDNECAIFPHLITQKVESVKPLAENLTASSCVNVNPYLYVEWQGTVKLDPSIDTWTETRYDPDEVLNGLVLGAGGGASGRGGFNNGPGGVDATAAQRQETIALLGADWTGWGQWMGLDRNTWRDIASQDFRDPRFDTINFNQGSTNITSVLSGGAGFAYSSITTDRLIGNENAAYARPITINYQIENMRPNATMELTLAGETMTLSDDQTDSLGNVTGTFEIPEFTIPTGSSLVLVEDSNATSTAQTTFQSNGIIERRARRTINLTWHDPLAQSFLVDSVGGAFLASVDIYVKEKPEFGSFSDHPLEVQIVEMVNGSPTSNTLRYSKVSLPSNLVNATIGSIDEDSVQQGRTTFQFSDPVFVEEGREYAIVVSSQSDAYCVWVSVLGEQNLFNDGITQGAGSGNTISPNNQLPIGIRNGYQTPTWDPNSGQFITKEEFDQIYGNPDLDFPSTDSSGTTGTGSTITRQPYLGSLFLSQNSTTWTADQMKDLTFSLKQYQFEKNISSYYIAKDNKKDQNGDFTIYGDTQTFSFNDVPDNRTFSLARTVKGLTESDIVVTHSINGELDAFADPIEYTLDVANDQIILTDALEIGESVTITTRETTILRRTQNQGSTLFLNLLQYVLPGTNVSSSYLNQKASSPSLGAGNILSGSLQLPNRQNKLLDAEIILDDGVLGHSTSPAADTNNLWIQNEFVTNNANITSVIEREGYRFVLVRNLAIPLNSLDNPNNASFHDTGKYIGKTVELLNEADDLRVLIDAFLPNSSEIRVFYRSIESDANYVSIERTSLAESIEDQHQSLFNEKCVVFDLVTNSLTQSSNHRAYVSGESFRSIDSSPYSGTANYVIGDTVIDTNVEYICISNHSSGDDAPSTPSVKWQKYDDRVYLTGIGDATAFDSMTDGYLIRESDIGINVTCPLWDGVTSISNGDHVVHLGKIWKNVSGGSLTNTVPTVQGTAWDLIPSIRIGTSSDGVKLDDAAGEWKPMKFEDPTTDPTSAQQEFIEFLYVPEISPLTTFEDFAIKIEMYSQTKPNVPIIRNLRAIAVV